MKKVLSFLLSAIVPFASMFVVASAASGRTLEHKMETMTDSEEAEVWIWTEIDGDYDNVIVMTNSAVLSQLGVEEENIVYLGTLSNSMILLLTKEEILKAAELDNVLLVDCDSSVGPFEPLTDLDRNLRGDADLDGVVSVLDATAIQKFKAAIITADVISEQNADADLDGEVSVLDAIRIQKYLSGICDLYGILL